MANVKQGRSRVVVHDRGARRRRLLPAPCGARRHRALRRWMDAITGDKWTSISDSSAAGGKRRWNDERGPTRCAKTASSALPTHYFELTFDAVPENGIASGCAAGRKATLFERFGLRSVLQLGNDRAARRAHRDDLGRRGQPRRLQRLRIARWGWQDNGWGKNVAGAPIRFNATGPQKLRIQARED